MGIESWGFSLPWFWSSSQPGASSSNSHRKSKRRNSQTGATGTGSKSKASRTRTEQIALNAVSGSDNSLSSESEWESPRHYPGLVNISGTYCFMNSTLQALASLTYLQPQIDAIHAKAELLDVPTPVIDALLELFHDLNTPKSSYHSLRPHGIISALSSPPPSFPDSKISRRSSTSTTLFNSREHQDAQELFQLVSECIKNEMGAVEKEGLRDRGIAGVLDFGYRASVSKNADQGSFPHYTGLGSESKSFAHNGKQKQMPDDTRNPSLGSSSSLTTKSVFDGLTANRRSCVKCGYTEAVMHFGFDNWQLAVPRLATSCRLEDCLEDYTRLEILKDCVCRKCSVLATHRRLLQELKTLDDALNLVPKTASSDSPRASSSSPVRSKPSASSKRRHKEVRCMEQSVRTALSEGRIEDENLLTGVRLERVVSPASTKQAMVARPPPVLALHLNRSVHYGQFASKNMIKVHFPEVLDLTPYTTSGSLSTVPTSAISTPSPPPLSLQASSFHQTPSSSSSVEPRMPSTTKSKKRSMTPTPDTYRASLSPSPAPETQRTIYRLTAVVCHYGQHSFGHYICYRRKPRVSKDKKNLAGDVPVLVGSGRDDEETEEEESDGRGRRRSRSKGKGKVDSITTTMMTNGFADPYSAYSRFSLQPSSLSYRWQDRSETLSGSGKGWLRISDDSVAECGIESVLAEGSGAFMLYYERAVWGSGWVKDKTPSNGIDIPRNRSDGKDLDIDDVDVDGDSDADRFSVGSEETLRPRIRVVDLNGSVGSLVSEVGVGVMKQKKNDKGGHELRMKDDAKNRESSMSLSVNGHLYASSVSSSSSTASSSKIFGPRIVRSVNARRSHSVGINGSAIPTSEMTSGTGSLTNGNVQHGTRDDQEQKTEDVSWDMTASAPSILQVPNITDRKSTKQPSGLGSKSTKTMMHHHSHTTTTSNPVKAR